MYFNIAIVLTLVSALQYQDVDKGKQSFKIEMNQISTILEIPEADNIILESEVQNPFCHVVNRTISTQTFSLNIIDQNKPLEYDFEMDSPFNFAQFVQMAAISDGMLALTSNMQLYLLKFNYRQIYNTNKFNNLKVKQFADILWEANLAHYGKDEIPQLYHLRESNMGLVLFSKTGYIFNVSEMEENREEMFWQEIANFKMRLERGISLDMDEFFFSAVGRDGLDIYVMREKQLKFIMNYDKFQLKDFVVVKIERYKYKLFLIEGDSENFVQLDLEYNSQLDHITIVIAFQIRIVNIEMIAFDTQDGVTFYVAYKIYRRYFLQEYQLEDQKLIEKQKIQLKSEIYDVDVSKEFVILSGYKFNQIMLKEQFNEKKYVTMAGFRDFGFLGSSQYELNEMEDFYFGINNNGVFLTKYLKKSACIQCQTTIGNQSNQIEKYKYKQQNYTLKYNQNVEINGTTIQIRYTQQIEIKIVNHIEITRMLKILILLIGIFWILSGNLQYQYISSHYLHIDQIIQQRNQNIRIASTRSNIKILVSKYKFPKQHLNRKRSNNIIMKYQQKLMLLLVLLQMVGAIKIISLEHPKQFFNVHLFESNIILELPFSRDAVLISHQNNAFCHLRQKTIQTETQKFTIIQDQDFKEFDFESDTPLNFRQFIAMVHIRDGMLAITSDSVMYMLKFNYNQIYKSSEFLTYGNGKEFASVVWKADLQTIIQSPQSKSELPQMVFAQESNLALILFSDSAQMFSVTEMEQNSKVLNVYTLGSWIHRKDRGLTKEVDGYIFTAVGSEGLDIYQLNQLDVKLLLNIQFPELNITTGSMYLKDFAITKRTNGEYHLFLLDINRGLMFYELSINNLGIQLKTGLNEIDSQAGGISVDTKNGKNIFVTYKQLHRYYVIEYSVNTANKTWIILNKVNTHSKLIDVDATDEFAIVQGLNQHQIIFTNTFSEITSHFESIAFTHLGLRDFQFFQATNQFSKLNHIKSDYQYDDFFFGITANQAFLTRFKIIPSRIVCYSENNNLTMIQQKYTIVYNESLFSDGQLVVDSVTQHKMDISVELVKTFLFQDQILAVEILAAILGSVVLLSLSVLCYWWMNFKKEQDELENQIKEYQINAQNQSIKKDNKLSIDCSMNKQNEI